MAELLFSDTETAAFKQALADHDAKGRDTTRPWNEHWAERDAIVRSQIVQIVRRAQARAQEYLSALLILVGSRGAVYLDFYQAFAQSDSDAVRELLEQHDTPESRRALYTILRALTQIPRSWATSATIRFLRGTGKQKGASYHGAGMFAASYGWKTREVKAVAEIMTGNILYSQVLMSYADVEQEVRDADPDFEVIDHDVTFKGTRVDRDKEFINTLCEMLEARGLAPVPTPAATKPKKVRKPKVFKSGDVIRKRTLRDLPLPAHVRIPIERYDEESGQWLAATMEQVVTYLIDGGYYGRALVKPGTTKAYSKGSILDKERKDWLDGAIYLGPWKSDIVKKDLKINFRFRRPLAA